MNEPTLQLLNDHLLVEFEPRQKLSDKLDLVMPERYLIQDADKEGEHDAYGIVTDRRTINPQIVKVIKGNKQIPDGSRCFVHYGAFEVAQWFTPKQAIIKSGMVFFMLDPIRTFPGNYLGEEVFIEGERTASGIYVTPYAETKLPCNVKILHAPEASGLKAGDEVISIDAANYTLTYQDKKYVKLRESEIVAKMVDGKLVPMGKNILVEWLDEDLSEIIAENDRRRDAKDLAIKYRLHVPDIDYTPLPPPKTVSAKVLALGDDINLRQLKLWCATLSTDPSTTTEIIVELRRGKGVMLNDNQWIVNMDAILYLHA